jgi:sugar phosphate isomerase/epimerase
MWAQQDRFTGEGFLDFLRIARDAGYEAIEPSHSTPVEHLKLLAKHPLLAVPSIHAPAPRERHGARWVMDYSLTAADPEERRLAIEFHCQTIDFAAELGARYVVVHLGDTERSPSAAERKVRQLYLAGRRDDDEMAEARREAQRYRADRSPLYLERARESLAKLVEHAVARGVGIGIENRLHFFEAPDPVEAARLMAPYPKQVVGYWHDVGHAEVLHRLGLIERTAWFRHCGDRVVGMHLHDVNDIVDHRAPGNGDVDWSLILPYLAGETARTLEINQLEPQDRLGPGRVLLRDLGIL